MIFGAAGLITAAVVLTYLNTFSAPLIFDDSAAITDNPSIRSLWPLSSVFAPPAECTTAGRPLANLSFALNYAWGGTAVWGYHAVNLALHGLATLALFGVVRRTLARIAFGGDALPAALAVALLWGVHPLLTGTITYISQRTEGLMGFCYLFTLYAFIRAAEKPSRGWQWASVLACFAGMASKEGMVTAPVLVLLYDRIYFTESFREIGRRRRIYYAALGASWLLLAFLLGELKLRSVGFGLGVTWWRYALTECRAILTYLRLVFWPHPLIFDYGTSYVNDLWVGFGLLAIVGSLFTAAIIALGRRPKAGFLIVAFFILLAPTSSVVPVATQPIAENRVYLPAAALMSLFVIGLYGWLGRKAWAIYLPLAVGLGGLAASRNRDYLSPLSLWTDTAAKRPANARAYENLGEAWHRAGRLDLARAEFEQAVRLEPTSSVAHNNLGTTLQDMGAGREALPEFEAAVRLKPDYATAQNNLGNALVQSGQFEEGRFHLEEALRLYADGRRLKPDLPETHSNLGNALLYQGKFEEARRHYQEAVRLKPDFPQAQMNLGVALRELGQLDGARTHLEAALRLRPDLPEVHFNLGVLFRRSGDLAAAQGEFEVALRLRPGFAEAHNHLGLLLLQRENLSDAQQHFEAALRLRPDYPDARTNLERVLALIRANPSMPQPRN